MKKPTMVGLLCCLSICLVGCNPTATSSSFPTGSSTENPSSSQTGSSIQTGSSSQGGTSNSESNTSSSSSSSSGSTSSSAEPTPFDDLPAIDYITIFVEKSTGFDHIWAWDTDNSEGVGKPNYTGGVWPGVAMGEFDTNWYTFDVHDANNIIGVVLNSGSSSHQSSDLNLNKEGYWWFRSGSISQNKPGSGSGDVSGEGYYHDGVTNAASYTDFKLWNDYPSSYWTTVNPYQGSRTDFRQESIYFAMTSRFYDGDATNNDACWDNKSNPASDPAWRGDFKGLIEKMDYIKALGFTAIWITPIVENASGYDYHGYHSINMGAGDPRNESEDVSFQSVIDAAHSRDMKIVLDVVFNHTGNFGDENLFPMFIKDNNRTQHDFGTVMHLNTNGPLLKKYPNYQSLDGGQQFQARTMTMKSSDGDPQGIYHHELNMSYEQFIEQTGSMAGDCVDLNTENPLVAEYLVRKYGEFIRMGVDAFRIDTMKHISRLTFNKYLWPSFYEFASRCENSHFFMFGEVCTRVREVWNHGQAIDSAPFYTWKENKEYPWGDKDTNVASTQSLWNDNANTNQRTTFNARLNGTSYHAPDHSQWSGTSVIDFPMHRNFQYGSAAFSMAVNNDQCYNDATYNVVYVDSHDYGPEIGSDDTVRYPMGESAWKENLNLMFTLRGVPCLYYGSEIQFQAGKTIDKGTELALSNSGRAYYGDHLEGQVTASGFGAYSASGQVQTTLSNSLAQHIIKLNKIRQKVPALQMGQYQTFGSGMSYMKRYTSGSIDSIALVSVSGGTNFSGIPSGTYVDLVSGNRVTSSGSLNVSVSGQGNLAVYVQENSSSGALGQIS